MGLAEDMAVVVERFRSVTFQGDPLRVFDNSNSVNPPCVWLPVPQLEFAFRKGQMDVTWTAFLVAQNTTTVSVSQTLSELMDAVAGLFPFLEARPQPLTLREGAQPVPTYQLTWQSRIKIGA